MKHFWALLIVWSLLLAWPLIAADERDPFASDPGGPRLVAIIVAQQRLAILAWPDGEQVVLAPGERHRGTELREVLDTRAVLQAAGEPFTLRVGAAP